MADVQQGSADQGVSVAAVDPRTTAQDDSTSGQSASDAAAAQAGFGATLPTVIDNAPASAAPPARDASATVANLSAQIAQKAGVQTTRFDVQLDPIGLGRVNISVEIDAAGAMSAALSFEKPEAASLLRAHASDLQQSLAQAGFNLSDSALSFSIAAVTGGGSTGQTAWLGTGADADGQQSQSGQSQNGQAHNAGRAFGAAGLAADQADQIATASCSLSARGLDIRI